MEEKRVGRKTNLTTELISKIAALVASGNYYDTVCKVLNIPTSTFYRWLEKGRAQKKGIFRELVEAIERAEGIAEASAVNVLWQAIKKKEDPRWALEFLSRRYPDKWSKKEHVDIGQKEPFKIIIEKVSVRGVVNENSEEEDS